MNERASSVSVVLLVIMAAALSACGQKGALMLPAPVAAPPGPVASPAASPSAATAASAPSSRPAPARTP